MKELKIKNEELKTKSDETKHNRLLIFNSSFLIY